MTAAAPANPATAGQAAPPVPVLKEPTSLLAIGDVAYLLHAAVPASWLFALARLRGVVGWLLKRRDRDTVRRNMLAVFGATKAPAEIEAAARRFFINQQLQNLLVMLAPRMSLAELEAVAPIEGIAHLESAIGRGKGAILLGSHVNSVSLFVAIILLRRKGYDVRVAMPTPKDPWRQTAVRKFVDRLAGRPGLREQLGAFYAQFNVRPIAQKLAQNTVIAMTGDGWHSAAFVDVEFLGRTVPFTTGAMNLARATGATVIPAFATGEPARGLTLILEQPFTVQKTPQASADLQASVAAYVRRVEHHVVSNPAGWQHWLVADLVNTMATWPQRSLQDRYQL